MKMSITTTQFIDEFKNYNRGNQFSYGALCALFDYYEEIDENYELDVIAICCEWTEYESLEDTCNDLNIEYSEGTEIECYNKLEDEYCVMYLNNGGLLIQN